MFDSISDSDQTTSREQNSTEIDTELQASAEYYGNNLQFLNDNLTKENTKLRAQFSEAVRCTSHMDDMHKKVKQLSKEINSLSIEKDDLKRRLDIALRTNDEIKQQFQSEKSKLYDQRKTDNSQLKRELLKSQEESKQQIDNLCEQLEKLSNAKDLIDVDYKVSFNTIQRIIASAGHYFQCTFSKVEDLIQFLEQPPALPLLSNIENIKQNPNLLQNNIFKAPSETSHKERKIRQILEENNKIRENIEKENARLKKAIKESSFTSNKTIEELNKRIQQINEDNSLVLDGQRHQISVLEAKVQALKTEVQKRKDDQKKALSQNNNEQNQAKSVNCETEKIKQTKPTNELDLANQQMHQRTVELENQIKILNEKLGFYEEKCRNLQTTIDTKEIEVDKVNHDFGAIKLVHQSTLDEVQTLRNALHSKESNPRDENQRNHKIHVLKGQLITLQKSNESQIQQIRELSSYNETSTRALESQTAEITKLKRELEIRENRIIEIKEELNAAREEVIQKGIQVQPDIMPAAIWKFNEFEASLTAEIDRIAMSPTLQPSTKLQHIYRSINNFFKGQLASKDKQFEIVIKENQAAKNVFNQFFVDVSIALSQKPCTYDDFFSKNGCKTLTDSILRFRNDFDELRRQYDIFDTVINHLAETMGFSETKEATSLISQINELKAQFVTQKMNLVRRKKRISSLKSAFNVFKLKTENESLEIREENEHLNGAISILTKNNKELNSNAQNLKRQIHKQKLQIEDYIRNGQEMEKRANQEKDQILKERDFAETELKEQITEISQKLKSTEQQLMNSEFAITKMKKVIQNMKSSIDEKEEKITQLSTENETSIIDISDKWNKEKAQIIQSYESAIAEIKNNNEEQRKDVEKLVQDLSNAQKKAKKAKDSARLVRQEKAQLEKDFEAQKLQTQRVKKAAEYEAKSLLVAAESEFNLKADEHKTKWENEKRSLFAYVADCFRQFFNPQDQLDEATFRAIINKASAELVRLMNSDMKIRKMVSAEMAQKTDDAVEKLVTLC